MFDCDIYYSDLEQAYEDGIEWVSPCEITYPRIDPDDIFDNLVSNMHEDASEDDLAGVQEFRAAVEAFNKAQTAQTWWGYSKRKINVAKAMEARQGQDPQGLDGDSHDSALGTSPTTATMSANASATGSGVTVTMGVALATPTYAVGLGVPFNFAQGFVAVGGSQVKVKACTIDIDLGLADDRRFVGQPTVSEQLEKQLREVTGTLDLEWVNRTQYDRFCKASESSLWLSLSAGSDTCNITSNVRFDGETPQMSGGDIVQQSVPFKAIQSSTAASALQAVLVNSDTVA